MRIVIIGPANPLRGGIAKLNDRLAIQFAKEGNEVFICNFKLQYPGILFPGKTQYTDAITPPERVKSAQLLNSINPFNWFKTAKKIISFRPDLIVVRYWLPFMAPSLGSVCRFVKRKSKAPIISIVDNIIPHEKRPGDHQLTKYFCKPMDGFLAMSKSVLNEIDQFDRIKPRIFSPHPIYDTYGELIPTDAAKAKLNLDRNYRYILFFGFIRDYKGLDLLLKAFAKSNYRQTKTRLLVAGEFYSNEEKYLNLIKELSLDNEVKLHTEFIPEEDVRYYFCASDIVAQPYKSATQSGVTQVAYHFNKPMLVTNVGGLPEIVTHQKSGYVVNINTEEIKDALDDFFENKRLDEMTEGVKDDKKRFSWGIMYKAIMQLMKMGSI